MRIKITKIKAVDNPVVETATMENYKYGQVNTLSPFVDYWVTGELLYPIKVGSSIYLNRDCRNGVKIDGTFRSSTVQGISMKEGKIHYVNTHNSVYLIEEL